MRNGCLKININDESALEVDENSTYQRLGRDEYFRSHYLTGPLARARGLLIVCQMQEKNLKILALLNLALSKSSGINKRIDAYFKKNKDDSYFSRYLIRPLAQSQELVMTLRAQETRPDVLDMLEKALSESDELRKRLNQYFEEKKKEKNEGDDEKSEGGNG